MNNRTILQHTDHRPIPFPEGPWIMKQVWRNLLFAHWPVQEADLLPFIPSGLNLQLFEGRPWISVSPFLIDPLRLRGLPPVPFTRRMLELNVRTYTEYRGKPGVLFFTLEASNPLAVQAARTIGHLPYHHARMNANFSDSTVSYQSTRHKHKQEAEFKARYSPISSSTFQAQPGSLLHWLTERYCLYTADAKGQLYSVDIHHLPWPLQEARIEIQNNTLTPFLGLQHDPEPSIVTFSERLDVLIWPQRKL
ncbi:YqjF family protein [Paenibacillus sp. SN-8-1]|uniref:YqjF family protein n=1 Tax=Paenibacillus sp. SN-8-1 TaxID=3435409 RepID=UPI003D9A3128